MNRINVGMGVSGRYRAILRDAKTEEIIEDTGWFDNLITNRGLYNIRDRASGLGPNMVIGSGTAAPDFTDVNLQSPLGTYENVVQTISGFNDGATKFWWRQQRYRWLEGDATGTVTEVGVGMGYTIGGGGLLGSRALLPAPIVKGVDQILDIWYERRNYPTITDQTGTLLVNGVSYDYIVRPAYLSTSTQWTSALGRERVAGGYQYTYDGILGTIYTYPAGSSDSTSMATDGTGQNSVHITATGNYYNESLMEWGLDEANFGAPGIRSMRISTGNCSWQIQFNRTSDQASISKTSEQRLRFTMRVNIARYP